MRDANGKFRCWREENEEHCCAANTWLQKIHLSGVKVSDDLDNGKVLCFDALFAARFAGVGRNHQGS